MFDWEEVIISTESGYLEGTLQKNSDNEVFHSFKGIPYAKPPVGALRFQDPEPVEKWPGVRKAVEYGNACTQYHALTRKFIGSEDCLYLNIYSKEVENIQELKPVMVFIHGGAFQGDSSDDLHYGPQFLMRKDIVLVTLNYRLGFFGFLNLEHEIAPGNQGLKDQVMALKWIKTNIKYFGGDPNNITLFGTSAGAVCIHYLGLSPMAKGLFHKVILQSGTVFNCWAKIKTPKRHAQDLCKFLGKDLQDPVKIYNFLKTVDDKKLVEAQEHLRRFFGPHSSKIPCGPGVDNKSSNPLMSIPAEEAAKQGLNIPTILGHNSREAICCMLRFDKDVIDFIDKNLDEILHLRAEDVLKEYGLIIEDLKQMYFKNDKISDKNIDAYIDMVSDLNFIEGLHKAIKIQIEKASTTYYYNFAYAEEQSLTKAALQFQLEGACHFDEIEYLFYMAIRKHLGLKPMLKGTDSYKIMEQLTELWTNFATHGTPVPTTSDLLPIKWRPLDNDTVNFRYLNIDKKLQMKTVENIENRLRIRN